MGYYSKCDAFGYNAPKLKAGQASRPNGLLDKGPRLMPLPEQYIYHPTCQTCNGVGRVPRVNGQAIRKLRQDTGYSLRTMADKLGISAAYLSDMELGRRRMSFELAEEIVAICEGGSR